MINELQQTLRCTILQPDAHSRHTANYKGCSTKQNTYISLREFSHSQKNYKTTIDKTSTKIYVFFLPPQIP